MPTGFLVQLAGSAVAISVLTLLAAWARIARPTPALDEAHLRTLLVDEFPDVHPGAVWICPDGSGAVARARDDALIVFRLGDGYVTRSIPWSRLAKAELRDFKAIVHLNDPAAPIARLSVPAGAVWPPQLSA